MEERGGAHADSGVFPVRQHVDASRPVRHSDCPRIEPVWRRNPLEEAAASGGDGSEDKDQNTVPAGVVYLPLHLYCVAGAGDPEYCEEYAGVQIDRKSTRLNSSHV